MLENMALLAEAGGSGDGSQLMLYGMIAIFGFFVFSTWKNNKKEQKRRTEMIDNLKIGDKVLTAGG